MRKMKRPQSYFISLKEDFYNILRGLFLAIFLLALWPVQSQDTVYARAVVDSLCSERMAGRGYIDHGDFKAARYIAREFRSMGLDSISNGYLQPFPISVNTFPTEPEVIIDGKKLTPGEDYIIAPQSGKVFGDFECVYYDRLNLPERKFFNKLVKKDFFKNKVIAIKPEGIEENEVTTAILENYFGAPAIITIAAGKLTWGVSMEQVPYGMAEVTHGIIDRQTKKVSLEIKNDFIRKYETQNVVAMMKGTAQPDSFMVLMAHYDHLGKMGESCVFRGANDNASGTAMLLNLAKYYKEHAPKYSIVFIAFGAEEAGLVGSFFFNKSKVIAPEKVKFYFNFDILGTGEEGIKVVNATVHKDAFKKLEAIHRKQQMLPAIEKRGAASISDHHFFHEAGCKGFYFYTLGGSKAYHDIHDVPENLTLAGFKGVFQLVTAFIDQL